jgi:hypothetical protein
MSRYPRESAGVASSTSVPGRCGRREPMNDKISSVSRTIERALDRWRRHPRLLAVLIMSWAALGLFFTIMAVVFAASGRPTAEQLAPWWMAIAAGGFVVAGLGELARRAVKDGPGLLLHRGQ